MCAEQRADAAVKGVGRKDRTVVAVPLPFGITEVANQARPAGESVFACDDELSVGEPDV
jgi:hypothetical protein